jgi:hypothetical protein
VTTPLVLVGSALVVVLAAAVFWRLSAPGKRVRFGACTLYYTPAVTADVVDRVVRYLKRVQFSEEPMTARLLQQGATYQFQVIFSDPPFEHQVTVFEVLAAGLSDDVFSGAPVDVQVCDSGFRPFVVIPHRGRYGRRITMNAAHLFYLEEVTDEEAFSVATFLAGVGVFDDSPKIAQLNRSADGYEFRLAVKVDPQAPPMIEGGRRMSADLSAVLHGRPVAVTFCEGPLGRTLRTVQPQAEEGGTRPSHVPAGPYRTEVLVPGEPPRGSGLADDRPPG